MTIIQVLPTDEWWSHSPINHFRFGVATDLLYKRMTTRQWRDIGWYTSNVIYKGIK